MENRGYAVGMERGSPDPQQLSSAQLLESSERAGSVLTLLRLRPAALRRNLRVAASTFGVWLVLSVSVLNTRGGTRLKSETFDRDPGWESMNNHVQPTKSRVATQDYGWSKGEVGGRVTRSARCTFYADGFAPKTLNDKLSASGTFRLSSSSGGSGVFFGWFNDKQPGGSGRPINSLGMDFDGENSGARLAVRMISGNNKSCGTFITPFIPGKYRPTPIKRDGTRYHWTLNYDPFAHSGKGQFTFTIKSDSANPQAFEGKPFVVDLPDGFKADGATFNHFGLMNAMKPGGSMTIHFSELEHDGKVEDLQKDPGWVGQGNHEQYAETDQVGAHDFGYSAGTSFAGGKAGEVGGKFWRGGKYGYYADRVGTLTLSNRLEARGKVVLLVGAPDSDMFFGWFSSAVTNSPAQAGNFLGVHIGGPTRVGHYFQPSFVTAKGNRGGPKTGPVLAPNRVFDWKLVYEPEANNGKGAIKLSLGTESIVFELRAGQKEEGAIFDRFGFLTSTTGGQMVKVYFDDLTYTSAVLDRNLAR